MTEAKQMLQVRASPNRKTAANSAQGMQTSNVFRFYPYSVSIPTQKAAYETGYSEEDHLDFLC